MQSIKILTFVMIISGVLVQVGCTQTEKEKMITPTHLYKILSPENWHASQDQENLVLSSDDDAFIHLSTADQLDRIAKKFWADKPEYIVLTIDTAQLPGQLKFEANPGGQNKYYHLYNGYIPLKAVTDVKTKKQE